MKRPVLFVPRIFLESIHQPTYAINKIQLITSITLLHDLATACHLQVVS